MSAETNKALVRRWYEEALTQRNPDLVEEIFTSDYVCHSSQLPANLPPGREGMKHFVTQFLSGYPRMRFTVGEQTVEGDKVHSQITAKSEAPVGPVMTIPGDPEKVAESDTITGTSTDRFVNDRIAESWLQFDVPNPLPQMEEVMKEGESKQ